MPAVTPSAKARIIAARSRDAALASGAALDIRRDFAHHRAAVSLPKRVLIPFSSFSS